MESKSVKVLEIFFKPSASQSCANLRDKSDIWQSLIAPDFIDWSVSVCFCIVPTSDGKLHKYIVQNREDGRKCSGVFHFAFRGIAFSHISKWRKTHLDFPSE